MIRLTARQLAHITGGRVASGSADLGYTHLATDSRSLPEGAMFLALVGDRFDGHDFIPDAFAAGARGVIASRPVPPHDPWPVPEQAPVWLEVADTQHALEAIARALRDFHPGRFIAVTGSVGKTTVKDMIAVALAPFGTVGRTPGNLNNHIGVPLTLAGLDGTEHAVVLELGMSAPGEIARLCHIGRPAVGLVTRATAAHLEFFPSVEGIADAKAELWEHLPAGGIAVVNADDARLLARAARPRPGRGESASEVITYGCAPLATIRVASVHAHAAGTNVTLMTPEGELELRLATVGAHNAHNAAGALAAIFALGRLYPSDKIALRAAARALSEGFRPGKHRLEVIRRGPLTIIDDCYNANPASMRAALEALATAAAGAEKTAVLGTMRELGPEAPNLHAELGREAARHGVKTLFATGAHADALAEGAREGGLTQVFTAADVMELGEALVSASQAGGWLLVKGSRGERLERVLDLFPSRGEPHPPEEAG